MVLVYLFLIIGFALLIKGADFFVEASASIARALKVPSIIIGLTIVAFGTSAPELAVSTTASLSGSNEIAVGNVIGSNIFNLLVVLGASGLVRKIPVKLRWDFALSIGAGVLLLAMIFWDRFLSRPEAAVFLLCFAAFVGLMIRDALKNRLPNNDSDQPFSLWKNLLFIAGGLAAIIYGGNLVVDCATEIALSFGLSQTLVGLTVVALGTSLPELVTSMVASRRGENGLALGNVIGSNIFNILLVLAVSAAVKPIPVNTMAVVDAACLVAFSAAVMLLCHVRHRIGRPEGALMLMAYAAYLYYIIVR